MLLSNNNLRTILLQELEEYDGKSTAILGEIAHRWSQEPQYPDALLCLFENDDPVFQNGASWLFKAFVERSEHVGGEVCEKLSCHAVGLNDWSAQLHVCQSVQYLTFAPNDARRLGEWALTLLGHDRPFLRAWSLDTLYRLSSFDQILRPAAKKALTQALDDSAASVRARARKLKVAGNT